MTSDSWVCEYVIEFSDGGEPESQVLHVGSKEDCERTADLVPAIYYSGTRPISGACVVVKLAEVADAAQ